MGTDMDMDMVKMFMATAQLHQAMERQRKLSMKVYKEENMAIIYFGQTSSKDAQLIKEGEETWLLSDITITNSIW